MRYQLVTSKVWEVDLSNILPWVQEPCRKFIDNPQGQHYKLLSYISNWFEGQTLLDVGTHRGTSALALAANKRNSVLTLNRCHQYPLDFGHFPITFLVQDITKVTAPFVDHLANIPFIFLDITHTGTDERKVMDLLETIDWQGILLLDDIHRTVEGDMPGFWNSITQTKYDLTHIGHSAGDSGTGLVDFSNQVEVI